MDDKAFRKAILFEAKKYGSVSFGFEKDYGWLTNKNVAALANGLKLVFETGKKLKRFSLYNAAIDDIGLAILAEGLDLFHDSLEKLKFGYMPKLHTLAPLFKAVIFPSLKEIEFTKCALRGDLISPEHSLNLPALETFFVMHNGGPYYDTNFEIASHTILLTASTLCELPRDCKFYYKGTWVDVLTFDGEIVTLPERGALISFGDIMTEADISCVQNIKSALKGVKEIKSALMYTKGNVGAAVRLLSS